MRDRTTIAIAHRLSTIRAADVIFALDGGRVVERGTHDELLAHGGLYACLYEEQFGDGLVEAHCADGVVLAGGRVARPSCRPAAREDERSAVQVDGDESGERGDLEELPVELRGLVRA